MHKKDLILIPSIDASILTKQISKFKCLFYSDTIAKLKRIQLSHF